MKTEYQKMLAGQLYDAGNKEPMEIRIKARALMQRYNQKTYEQ